MHYCSIYSRRTKNATAPTSLTSSCWHTRLVDVTDWLPGQQTPMPPGPATSAPARERARQFRRATDPSVNISAVVSRGGRPDLAGECLTNVRAPTLLIVGGRDETVLELNQRAQAAIPCECELVVVPGPPSILEEPGTLEKVAALPVTGYRTLEPHEAAVAHPTLAHNR